MLRGYLEECKYISVSKYIEKCMIDVKIWSVLVVSHFGLPNDALGLFVSAFYKDTLTVKA